MPVICKLRGEEIPEDIHELRFLFAVAPRVGEFLDVSWQEEINQSYVVEAVRHSNDEFVILHVREVK